MPLGLLHLWDKVRGSFWFVPLGMMLLTVCLALGVTWLDNQLDLQEDGPAAWLIVNAETARSTLSLLAGAMITLAGVVFSMTMVTLSLTSNQFGSRLLRTAMTDGMMQFALGAFLSVALYSLVVMRFIPLNADSPFVPDIAVSLAGLLAFLSLVTMILFVHHIGITIQAQNVVAEVARELNNAIRRVFPEELGEASARETERSENDQPELGSRQDGSAITLPATRQGYLQTIDVENLMSFAVENDLRLELLYRPGDFVIQDTPLARLLNLLTKPSDSDLEKYTAALNDAILTGRSRTPLQDVCCAVNELVEVAVRALSPGVNDPFTAVACIDHMTAALRRLLRRKIPSAYRYDEEHQLRVIVNPLEISDVMEAAFRPIGHYGAGDFQIALRMMEGLEQLSRAALRAADREAISDQARRLFRKTESLHEEPRDRERLSTLLDRICGTTRNDNS